MSTFICIYLFFKKNNRLAQCQAISGQYLLGTNFSILNVRHSYRLGQPVAVQAEKDRGSTVSLGNAPAPELPSYWTDSFCIETLPEGFQPRQRKDRLLRLRALTKTYLSIQQASWAQ